MGAQDTDEHEGERRRTGGSDAKDTGRDAGEVQTEAR